MNPPTRMCESCRMRYRVNPPSAREFYNPLPLSPHTVQWIENAAKVFDLEADQRFTAAEFVAWMRPELVEKAA